MRLPCRTPQPIRRLQLKGTGFSPYINIHTTHTHPALAAEGMKSPIPKPPQDSLSAMTSPKMNKNGKPA